MATVIPTPRSDLGVAVDTRGPVRYVDWAAVFGGAFIAMAIGSLFITFGSAIGLSLTTLQDRPSDPDTAIWLPALAAGLWLLWVQISSSIGGGYFAGRMRGRVGDATPHESEMRDGAHGLLVWAVGLVVASIATALTVAWLATLGAAGATALAGQAAQSASVDYYVDRLLRTEGAPAAADAAAAGTTAEQPATAPAAGQPTQQTMAADEQQSQRMARILARNRTTSGDLDRGDRTYLAQQVSEATGLPQAEAEAQVDQTVATMRDAADDARKVGIVLGFMTAASLLISALAAWWAACAGGRHRNEDIDHSMYTRWR